MSSDPNGRPDEDTAANGRRCLVRAVRDRSGSGEVMQVLVEDVAVWTWVLHVDGPPSSDAEALFSALERWLPVGEEAPLDRAGRYRTMSEDLAELERTDPAVRAAAEALTRTAEQIVEGRVHALPCLDESCRWHHENGS